MPNPDEFPIPKEDLVRINQMKGIEMPPDEGPTEGDLPEVDDVDPYTAWQEQELQRQQAFQSSVQEALAMQNEQFSQQMQGVMGAVGELAEAVRTSRVSQPKPDDSLESDVIEGGMEDPQYARLTKAIGGIGKAIQGIKEEVGTFRDDVQSRMAFIEEQRRMEHQKAFADEFQSYAEEQLSRNPVFEKQTPIERSYAIPRIAQIVQSDPNFNLSVWKSLVDRAIGSQADAIRVARGEKVARKVAPRVLNPYGVYAPPPTRGGPSAPPGGFPDQQQQQQESQEKSFDFSNDAQRALWGRRALDEMHS